MNKIISTLVIGYGIMMIILATVVFPGYFDRKNLATEKNQEPEVSEVSETKAIKVNMEHVRCLALNIYHEANGEPFLGQVAVARVVMNRIKYGFAGNPCKVVYQYIHIPVYDDGIEKLKKVCQFSWVCEGKNAPGQNQRYKQAEEIAHRVLSEDAWHDIIPGNVLFFHNRTVDPDWGNYRKVMTIGNHVFYSKK